jgi:hypothetical protein
LWLRVFESSLSKSVFGAKREKITGGWRRLHNEDLHNFNTAPNIFRVTKSRKIRLAGHVARIYTKF